MSAFFPQRRNGLAKAQSPHRIIVKDNPLIRMREAARNHWSLVVESLTRPYQVTIPMVLLISLVPLYLFIPDMALGPMHVPELALDRLVPLQPAWALVYGSVYFFLIVLPVLLVRQREHIRGTVRAYLMVWLVAYVCFLAYPTVAPRGEDVDGEGFGFWGLRLLYSSDPPYNCFPSIHVAHSFVSALTIHRVHRGVGIAALIGASLVGLSTLLTKQHYIADVIAGIFLAYVACFLFLRNVSADEIPELDRRLAPVFAWGMAGLIGLGIVAFWVVYRMSGEA